MRLGSLIALGSGGAAIAVAGIFASRRATAHVAEVKRAVEGLALESDDFKPSQLPTGPKVGSSFRVHATGYWPKQVGLSVKERKMEGKPVDRKGKSLYTVEDFFDGKSDHVSVAGDSDIFPYAQKIVVNWFDKTLIGRITDTGGHFHGLGKLYRVFGEEPLDFAVNSSKTPVPKKGVVAQIVVGDHLDKGVKEVALSKFKGQTVSGLDILGGLV